MIPVEAVEFKTGTKEELLPDYHMSFPHICTCMEFQDTDCKIVPEHWHKVIEIVYVERGKLVHATPSGEITLLAGSGAILNTNVLHSAAAYASAFGHKSLHHFFDPSLIAGTIGNRIEQNYVLPFLTAKHIDIIALKPDDPSHAEVLSLIRDSFLLSPEEPGYELYIRNILTEIWLRMLEIAGPKLSKKHKYPNSSDTIQKMLPYIHEHYGEKITVSDLADAFHISKHACYSLFEKHFHTTPADYLNEYRLRMAYQMLTQTEASVGEISASCGMSGSYFTKVFRETTGYTPLEYRRFFLRRNEPSDTNR